MMGSRTHVVTEGADVLPIVHMNTEEFAFFFLLP